MAKPSILSSLRILADINRLRTLLLLQEDELSVAELQEILAMGQSTISTHLSQLKHAGLVEDRRTGKHVLYRAKRLSQQEGGEILNQLISLLKQAAIEIPEAAGDRTALQLVLRRRQEKTQAFFNEIAGRHGRDYVPGRSWKSIAALLMELIPCQAVADLGAGEGALSRLIARNGSRVIAVDNSERMVEIGTEQSRKEGISTLEYRRGDMEEVPIENNSIDIALFCQSLHHAIHPPKALTEAHRILKPRGRVFVLDLAKHRFEEARELYADLWPGFSRVELESLLDQAGFSQVRSSIVDRESEKPHLQTLLAVGSKI